MSIITPATADEAAALLAEAHRSGRRIAILGGGTKAGWSPAAPADDTLSTLALNRVVAHRHGDLTATVEAGSRFDDVNRELARQGQWIALDPMESDRATIGGIVATNDSGPRRHRFGAPRDVIIGIDIVRADGVRAKAGGIVVKNVAGYDIARLMTGSFGSLALITSVTVKLYPLPAASRTLMLRCETNAVVAEVVTRIASSQLTPTAVEVQSPPRCVLVRFESTEASVRAQSAAAQQMAKVVSAEVLEGDAEQALWQAHGQRPWKGSGAVVKVTFLPADLAGVLDAIDRAAAGAAFDMTGRAAVGVVHVRLDLESAPLVEAIESLKARAPLNRGSAVVLRGPDSLKQAADSGGGRVIESVKRAFDPSGVLAYRGVY